MNFQFLGVRREVLGGGLMGLRREERRLGGQAARVRMPACGMGAAGACREAHGRCALLV